MKRLLALLFHFWQPQQTHCTESPHQHRTITAPPSLQHVRPSLSTPADHSDFAIKWPWRPYASISQPHESFSTHRYKEKSALVKKIANVYEKPLPNDDTQRQFTGWQNAIFYSFEPIALRAITPFPHVVKSIGDKAKTFGALGKLSMPLRVHLWTIHAEYANHRQ